MLTRRLLLSGSMLGATLPARSAETVRIGQATTSLSFLPLWAARALDTFSTQDLALSWAAIPGGDPAALAALDLRRSGFRRGWRRDGVAGDQQGAAVQPGSIR